MHHVLGIFHLTLLTTLWLASQIPFLSKQKTRRNTTPFGAKTKRETKTGKSIIMNLEGFYQGITKGTQDHTCITGKLECEKLSHSTLLPPSPMPSKKIKKKRHFENIASAYNEDLGLQGVKKKSAKKTGTVIQPSNFHLPLTEEEEHRRHQRMVRPTRIAAPRILHVYEFNLTKLVDIGLNL